MKKSLKKKQTNETKNTTATETEASGESTTEPYRPVVRGSASICSWTLEFRFLTREQCLKFINLFLDEFTYADNIKYNMVIGDSLIKDEHWVTVENVSWANNLTKVGELLEQCDYRMD